MCAGGRHGTGAEWVLDGKSVRVSWSFLVPVMADESEQRVQVFFQKKVLLNAASMPWELILQLVHSLLKGSFFKSSARDLDLASLKEDTMMVKFPQVKSTAIFLETCPTEAHWRGLKRSQGQSG